MTRARLAGALLALVLVGCGSTQPTPTIQSASSTRPTTSSLQPTSGPLPSPTIQATPKGAPPSSKPTPTGTPELTPVGSSPPFTLSLTTFTTGLQALTFATNAGDGSSLMYAVEQRGAIWQVGADGTVASRPFLDITERVSSGGERGLLGLAFDPAYASNGRLFVLYTDLQGNDTLSEFARTSATAVDPGSEHILLTVTEPFPNHNGGMLAFGPDGDLYFGTGDGGAGGDPFKNGQNGQSLLGKILRLDVSAGDSYAIPAANPFANGPNLPEIWDFGLRNPWRFSFDRETGDLWIGDVGQSEREEVDAEPAGRGGRNYGWNVMEGSICYAATTCDQHSLTLPVYDYSHDGGNCSVTGGYVYRGAAYPALVGQYIFSDFCGRYLWAMDAAQALTKGTGHVSVVGQAKQSPSSFAEDEAGELYLVDHNGGLYKVVSP